MSGGAWKEEYERAKLRLKSASSGAQSAAPSAQSHGDKTSTAVASSLQAFRLANPNGPLMPAVSQPLIADQDTVPANTVRLDWSGRTPEFLEQQLSSPDNSFMAVRYFTACSLMPPLQSLPSSFASLSALQELDLSHNQLTHAHGIDVLGETLLSLRLDFNAIRQIDGLDACHLLRNLSLAHNQIKAVRNIGHLRNLESLNLSFNAIPTLDALRPLSVNTSLRVLQIKGNPIAASNRLVANVLPGLLELDGENAQHSTRRSSFNQAAPLSPQAGPQSPKSTAVLPTAMTDIAKQLLSNPHQHSKSPAARTSPTNQMQAQSFTAPPPVVTASQPQSQADRDKNRLAEAHGLCRQHAGVIVQAIGNLALSSLGASNAEIVFQLGPSNIGHLQMPSDAVLQALSRLEITPHRVPTALANGLLQSICAASGSGSQVSADGLLQLIAGCAVFVSQTYRQPLPVAVTACVLPMENYMALFPPTPPMSASSSAASLRRAPIGLSPTAEEDEDEDTWTPLPGQRVAPSKPKEKAAVAKTADKKVKSSGWQNPASPQLDSKGRPKPRSEREMDTIFSRLSAAPTASTKLKRQSQLQTQQDLAASAALDVGHRSHVPEHPTAVAEKSITSTVSNPTSSVLSGMHAAAAHLMSKKSNEKSVVDHKAKRAAADAAVAASVGGTVNFSKLTEKKSRDPDAQATAMDRLSRARSAPRTRAEPIESKPQARTSSASRARPVTASATRPAEKPKGKFAQAEPYFSLSEINTSEAPSSARSEQPASTAPIVAPRTQRPRAAFVGQSSDDDSAPASSGIEDGWEDLAAETAAFPSATSNLAKTFASSFTPQLSARSHTLSTSALPQASPRLSAAGTPVTFSPVSAEGFDESALLADTVRFNEISKSTGPTLGAGVAMGRPASLLSLRDKDLEATPRVKAIIKNLNEKINKLYNWHLVEIDLVSRQQMQLNEMKTELSQTKSFAASSSAPQLLSTPSAFFTSPPTPLNLLNTSSSSLLTQSTPSVHQASDQSQQQSIIQSATQVANAVSEDPASVREALERSLAVLQTIDARAEEVSILRSLLSDLPSEMAQPAPVVAAAQPVVAAPAPPVDETTDALVAAGFAPPLTKWLKELEDELAAAQMGMHNLLDMSVRPNADMQLKVASFQKQLESINMFAPFPLPTDVINCFADLPEEMMSIIREHAQTLDVTKDTLKSFAQILLQEPIDEASIAAVREDILSSGLIPPAPPTPAPAPVQQIVEAPVVKAAPLEAPVPAQTVAPLQSLPPPQPLFSATNATIAPAPAVVPLSLSTTSTPRVILPPAAVAAAINSPLKTSSSLTHLPPASQLVSSPPLPKFTNQPSFAFLPPPTVSSLISPRISTSNSTTSLISSSSNSALPVAASASSVAPVPAALAPVVVPTPAPVVAQSKDAQSKDVQSKDEWACPVCTFHNVLSQTKCEMCATPRAAPLTSAASAFQPFEAKPVESEPVAIKPPTIMQSFVTQPARPAPAIASSASVTQVESIVSKPIPAKGSHLDLSFDDDDDEPAFDDDDDDLDLVLPVSASTVKAAPAASAVAQASRDRLAKLMAKK